MADDLTGFLHRAMPLCAVLGMRLDAMERDETVVAMDWAPERCTAGGVLHGGALLALADAAGALAAYVNLPPGASTTTIESKTNMLRAVTEGAVSAVARPLHVGSTTIVVETEIRDGQGRLVAKTLQTQAVRPPRPEAR